MIVKVLLILLTNLMYRKLAGLNLFSLRSFSSLPPLPPQIFDTCRSNLPVLLRNLSVQKSYVNNK